jgi:hypothetical protein
VKYNAGNLESWATLSETHVVFQVQSWLSSCQGMIDMLMNEHDIDPALLRDKNTCRERLVNYKHRIIMAYLPEAVPFKWFSWQTRQWDCLMLVGIVCKRQGDGWKASILTGHMIVEAMIKMTRSFRYICESSLAYKQHIHLFFDGNRLNIERMGNEAITRNQSWLERSKQSLESTTSDCMMMDLSLWTMVALPYKNAACTKRRHTTDWEWRFQREYEGSDVRTPFSIYRGKKNERVCTRKTRFY